MTQQTSFGEATLTTYIRVTKKDGTERFYKVTDGLTEEVNKETYLREGGQ